MNFKITLTVNKLSDSYMKILDARIGLGRPPNAANLARSNRVARSNAAILRGSSGSFLSIFLKNIYFFSCLWSVEPIQTKIKSGNSAINKIYH